MISNKRTLPVAIPFLALIAASNSGCGGGSSAPPISVSVSPISVTVQSGTTAQFTASVLNDTAGKGVTWTVSCSAAPCGSVSPTSTLSGVSTTYTPPVSPPASNLNVTITAASVAVQSATASATISVAAISVVTTPTTATVQVGGTADFSAQVNNDGANAGVTWTVACSVAPCGSVLPTSTQSGMPTTYTAPATPPTSNLSITLTGTSITDITKSATVTVTVPSVGITVNPPTATVMAGGTSQLTATLTTNSSNKGVAWTVSCSPGPCGSVAPASTPSGAATTYTAPATPPANDLQVTVTATSVANSLATASATITVPAITVTISPESATVEGTGTQQLTATVANDPSNGGVTWTVSCSPSPCGSVSPTSTANGAATTYTAPPPPPSDMTVSVTATSSSDATKSFTATITVAAIAVSAVSPPSGIIPLSVMVQFTATVSNDPSHQGLNWTLTQNGTACSPACGTVSPPATASGASTTYSSPATLPANTTVTLNAIAAADTTKISTATITLTNGVIEFIPASLSFTCKINKTCPPPAKSITLTYTGTATLTINSITTTGVFSETNDCSASVAAAGSCTILVTFNPPGVGTFNGTLAIADSSPDSPQQIALSGKATTFRRILSGTEVLSDLANTTSAAVPAPTGPAVVGTRVINLVDPTREDPYLVNGTRRELAIRTWYPASLNSSQTCKSAQYASTAVWNHFAQLVGVKPFPVATNSCQDAAVARGLHPVVLFSPGYTATFTDYTFLMEDLASRGYVVISVAHTYETTAVELSGGRLAQSLVGSHLGGTTQRNDPSLSSAVYNRLLDLKFVLNEISRMNSERHNSFAGRLDMAKIVVAGHSLGGLTALLASELDPRVKGAILMDGFVPDSLPSGTRKPVLILGAAKQQWDVTECRLWNNLQGPRLAVNLPQTEHVALSDWIWLTRDAVQTGPMGPEKTMSAMRDYIAAFLDANVRGESPDPLLAGPSPSYPDASVTTQQQPLCSSPEIVPPDAPKLH